MIQRLNATLEGRYRIERELGEGGMAIVYLAEDVRHQRHVALKVLRPELAAVVGAERFLAEIQVTANLQHPHILPLFDSGEADGFLFYVMPYVEGESLRQKLDREKQLPVDEAVRISSAVASALDYAHRQGVVHRDIKPANILLHDGEPVVADFGIALAVQEAGAGRLTETGLSLGTPYYMSPEQATADRDPGPRSDVYSLGCVVYEMLTGDPPFTGSSAQTVLGKILTGAPAPPAELRRSVPPHVSAAVLHALEKLPADRFGSAAEFARALQDPGVAAARYVVSPGAGTAPPRTGLRGWAPWGVAALAVAALAVDLALPGARGEGRPPPTPPMRTTMELPPNAAVSNTLVRISRAGDLVVVTGTWDGQPMILGRRVDEMDFFPIAGTEGGINQFLSPDAAWVAFRGAGATRKVPVSGGPVQVMDAEGDWAGGDWTADGTVFYDRSYLSGVWRIPADGGDPEKLTDPGQGELAHWWPQALPDGKHVLFTAFRTPLEQSRIAVVSLRDGKRKDVFTGGVDARYVPTGHLLFARDEALWAVPFDLGALEVTGDPALAVNDVAMMPYDAAAAYDVSDDGTLVYVPASDFNAPSDLVWVDREGHEELAVPEAGRYANPAVSPDGRSVAVSIASSQDAGDVYVLDLVRGTRLRVAVGPATDFSPAWTPDGRSLVYVSESPVFDLALVPADASIPPSPLVTDAFDKYPGSFTPDGDTLLFEHHLEPHVQIWKVPVAGGDATAIYTPEFDARTPALASNGRWLAYVSGGSGRDQVYLSPYPDPARGRRQVSVDGGSEPRWTRDGHELVFRSGGSMVAVPVDPDTGELGRPQVLFEGSYEPPRDGNSRNYDVTPDGERFLMVKRPPERAPRRIVVVTRFFDELKALGDGGG